jgi:transcriptional antiterminator
MENNPEDYKITVENEGGKIKICLKKWKQERIFRANLFLLAFDGSQSDGIEVFSNIENENCAYFALMTAVLEAKMIVCEKDFISKFPKERQKIRFAIIDAKRATLKLMEATKRLKSKKYFSNDSEKKTENYKIIIENEDEGVKIRAETGKQKIILSSGFFLLAISGSQFAEIESFSNLSDEGRAFFAILTGISEAKSIFYEKDFAGKFPEEYEEICSAIIDAERAEAKLAEATESLKSKKYSSNL